MDTPLTVDAVMTKDPITVTPDTEFKDIAALLTAEEISAVPVVEDGRPIGVVSEADLLCKEDIPATAPTMFSGRRARHHWRKAQAVRARDLMTAPVRTVEVGTGVAAAAHQLTTAGSRRLFVVDQGKLVGVVSRRDLLDVFLRPDPDVRREVEEEVFTQVLRAEPASFTVTVEHGVVTVLGRLERRSAVSSAERLIALVPGVVGVRNRLDYVWNDEV
ncbi:CBS domain-containing protein [Amycolatopsis pigmentata]|uniref:CBS domain-containing protein n=1 Tax=Amycolatopsis pigmentata TaxID=450801 RepID=A0ABW5FRN3_9PSEU